MLNKNNVSSSLPTLAILEEVFEDFNIELIKKTFDEDLLTEMCCGYDIGNFNSKGLREVVSYAICNLLEREDFTMAYLGKVLQLDVSDTFRGWAKDLVVTESLENLNEYMKTISKESNEYHEAKRLHDMLNDIKAEKEDEDTLYAVTSIFTDAFKSHDMSPEYEKIMDFVNGK